MTKPDAPSAAVLAERERCARHAEGLIIGDEDADEAIYALIAAIREGDPAE